MPTFTRLKTWVSNEVLTASDLNAEFNNQLNNMDPEGIEDASASVSDMQATTDPGGSGSESQATDLLGELKRLRYAIKRIVGGAQWYTAPVIDLGSTISAGDIASDAITTAKILNANVTRAKLEAVGQQLSSSSGTYSMSSGTSAAVTNLSCAITTTGRPVMVKVIADGSGSNMYLEMSRANDAMSAIVLIKRDATVIYRRDSIHTATSAASVFSDYPAPEQVDIVAAGTYTYTVEVACGYGTNSPTVKMYYSKLLVYEL
jgi:hypothetical protein